MVNDVKKFKIPKSFTLFGHKYQVVLRDDIFEAKGYYGLADDDAKIILIQKAKKVSKLYEEENKDENEEVHFEITDEAVVETFYHEICHIIFFAIGENKLSENETLVNMLGKAWLEIYLSSTYEKDSQEEV